MKLLNKFTLLSLGLFACLSFTGCEDDDPEIENEEELITDVILTLTPTSGTAPAVVLSFQDRDGDGGLDPVRNQVNDFQENTTYSGTLQLTAVEADGGVEDIAAEVLEEDDEHQVFYVVTNGLNLTPAYADMDDAGEPLGLLTTFQTGASSSGELTVTLIHEPNKGADNTISNPAAVGGSTDVEVTFDIAY
ncbi:hypothetical protein [Lewinella sp. 4G2]|uniref:hypothetical protein n=1 Tax=Lewinella sp. 4G2 TaxID=1803372 RepID=UPI0007B4A4E5|nr:hypothetical protein [Lewinella sp. 4G2]OAV45370.1 hypothetical protein A3850_013095 [Lewinella sp. 4G2]